MIFFDEIDALAPNRGAPGGAGVVTSRIVSQLMSEFDAMKADSLLFILGATNRPDLVDPSLLRPGRFDTVIFMGPPFTHCQQQKILSALSRRFLLAADVDMLELANHLPLEQSGAALYSLCAKAVALSLREFAAGAVSRNVAYDNHKHADHNTVHAKIPQCMCPVHPGPPAVHMRHFLSAVMELVQ